MNSILAFLAENGLLRTNARFLKRVLMTIALVTLFGLGSRAQAQIALGNGYAGGQGNAANLGVTVAGVTVPVGDTIVVVLALPLNTNNITGVHGWKYLHFSLRPNHYKCDC